MIPRRRDKDLSLVLEAPKSLAVNDSVTISLKTGSNRVRIFRPFAPP